MQIESKRFNISLNVIFVLLAVLTVFPVLLVFSISFTDQSAIAKFGYQLIPSTFSLDAYRYIFSSGMGIGRAYGVTIFATVVGTAISVLVIALYAYPLSRSGFLGKGALTFFIFFTMLFSGGMVSWYMIMTKVLKLSNTVWALILPYAMNAWYVIIMRTFFQTSVPDALIEAAKIEGAGEFKILFRVVFPISLPAIATIALFQTLTYWNDWYNPMLLITNPKLYNLQFLLQVMMKNIQMLTDGSMDSGVMSSLASNIPEESVRMALCVIAMGPILIVYPFFQKYFIQGLTVGAVKG